MAEKQRKSLIILMGATGDLARRKLLPALYNLFKTNEVGPFFVLGVGLEKTTPLSILHGAESFVKEIDSDLWLKFARSFFYMPLDFYNIHHYQELKAFIITLEYKQGLSGNRLFYLATLPDHFSVITKSLASSGLIGREEKDRPLCGQEACPWSRVIYEKPFGRDLRSARAINRLIAQFFDESQVFRIDHYLAKEQIGNITLVRFANSFFEPLWNKNFIESVQFILTESIDVSGRERFYDTYGATRDVVQNHLLQMIALIGMEPPVHLSGEYIRDAKQALLKKIVVDDLLVGQYEGYRNNPVTIDSHTETFVALKLSIPNKRWYGVNFFIKTGKSLHKSGVSIHLIFKRPVVLLDSSQVAANCLTITIQPEEGFFLEINTKTPGKAFSVEQTRMNFCTQSLQKPNSPEAYQTLLADAIRGDQSAFVRFDEIESSWKIIDRALKKPRTLFFYKKKSPGPDELVAWSEKHGLTWKE